VPLIDVSSSGEEQGKVSKYLILPSDFKGDMPPGYIPVRSQTNNGFGRFLSPARG
jgi:hypothetical protein